MHYRSFEVVHWMVSTENTILNLLGIYHPLCLASQKITNSMFLDDLTKHHTEWMSSFKNIFIVGDFNIHIDNMDGPYAQIFNDTMEALGLLKHVTFPTHCAGSTLDLILQNTSKLYTKISKGTYISDHRGHSC